MLDCIFKFEEDDTNFPKTDATKNAVNKPLNGNEENPHEQIQEKKDTVIDTPYKKTAKPNEIYNEEYWKKNTEYRKDRNGLNNHGIFNKKAQNREPLAIIGFKLPAQIEVNKESIEKSTENNCFISQNRTEVVNGCTIVYGFTIKN